MGGNAFENTKRMNEMEYIGVKEQLKDIMGVHPVRFIPHVREKKEHGDLDALVYGPEAFEDVIAYCEKNNFPYKKQVNQLSFMLAGQYQVDLIVADWDVIEYSQKYFSYNDLGNILGRMIRSHGYKHGHNGLFYVYRHQDNESYSKDILISTNYYDVLKLLKLDWQKFNEGFDTFQEMFEYVASSPFFDKSKFAFSALNNRNRVRDRKRKTYNMFLEFCETQPDYVDNGQEMLDPIWEFESEDLKDKGTTLWDEILKLDAEYAAEKDYKERFNGNMVSLVTGLYGQELGKFMQKFLSHYPKEQLKKLTKDEIRYLVKQFVDCY